MMEALPHQPRPSLNHLLTASKRSNQVPWERRSRATDFRAGPLGLAIHGSTPEPDRHPDPYPSVESLGAAAEPRQAPSTIDRAHLPFRANPPKGKKNPPPYAIFRMSDVTSRLVSSSEPRIANCGTRIARQVGVTADSDEVNMR